MKTNQLSLQQIANYLPQLTEHLRVVQFVINGKYPCLCQNAANESQIVAETTGFYK